MSECVLVTGGSGGIGSALCRQFAKAGYKPLIGYFSGQETATALAEETGGMLVALDLTSTESIDAAVNKIADETDRLAGIVLAASPPPAIAPIFRLPDNEIEKQFSVNVIGSHALLARAIRRLMRPHKQGWVVGLLSEAMGIESVAAKSMGGYIVAKYGLMGSLKATDAEYAWLSVHTASPGYTDTPMLDVFDSRFLDQMRAAADSGGFSSPEEVAAGIISQIRGV